MGVGKCPVLWIPTLAVFLPVSCCVLSSARLCLSRIWLAHGQHTASKDRPPLCSNLMWGELLEGMKALALLPGTQTVLGKRFLHLESQNKIYCPLLSINCCWAHCCCFTAAPGHVWVAPNKPWHSLLLSSAERRRTSGWNEEQPLCSN